MTSHKFTQISTVLAHTLLRIHRDANLAKRFAVFLGLKKVFWIKNSIFTLCSIHMCSNKLREKTVSIFLNPPVYLRYFAPKNSTKYCKKVTLGISVYMHSPSRQNMGLHHNAKGCEPNLRVQHDFVFEGNDARLLCSVYTMDRVSKLFVWQV